MLLTACTPGVEEPEMVLVPPGEFVMGDNSGPPNAVPAHRVILSRAFYIATTELTRAEFRLFCDDTGRRMPDSRSADDPLKPVVGVDWTDAVAYCNWLSERTGRKPCYEGRGVRIRCNFDADGYRLPTEAEWEYAAAGTDPDTMGRFNDLSGAGPAPVATLPSSPRGLYDMAGNSFEWCWDWYDEGFYAESPVRDPTGPAVPVNPSTPRGPEKVRRSGSWRESREAVIPTARSLDNIYYAGDNGFRLVRTGK
jgi:formylglycine-generating enzyme required for sulfatase activity